MSIVNVDDDDDDDDHSFFFSRAVYVVGYPQSPNVWQLLIIRVSQDTIR